MNLDLNEIISTLSSRRWYSYSTREQPPLLVLEATVSSPYFDIPGLSYEGKIDTGASMTCIPIEVANSLGLSPRGTVKVSGYRKDQNGPHYESTFEATISLAGFSYYLPEVIATHRDNVLIGRDIINKWILLLHGGENKFILNEC